MKLIYKIPFILSIGIMVISLVVLAKFGLRLSIDFTGGSLLEIKSSQVVDPNTIKDIVRPVADDVSVVAGRNGDFIIRSRALTENEHAQIIAGFQQRLSDLEEIRFDSIGPVVGNDLKQKSYRAVILATLAISLYIAFAFRKLKNFLNVWIMSFASIFAMVHDVLVPLGVFAVLGHYKGVEIDSAIIAAVLTILGYSMVDTVVVFDRARENFLKTGGKIRDVFHESIKQTLTRSINTTLTTLLSLIAVFVFGGQSLHNFSLFMIVGIASGAYSSIFVASALMMWRYRS